MCRDPQFGRLAEGIASNVLTDRLAKLERAGIVTKEPDDEDARKYRYRLTAKGIDLAPLMVEIVLWSARHEDTQAPATTIRQMRRNREAFIEDVRKGLAQT
jgi:DNA-binding HxlR family transcriptional regulator